MASSSSKSKPQRIYDVFINFRGKDTRNSFVSHLYAALSNAGINTFLDDENLERGKELGPELMRAIEGSQYFLVVLSKNYASSTWCLRELVKILECSVSGGIVMPIFYDVDPSEVRKQSGKYRNYFVKHEESFKDDLLKMMEVKRWKDALTEVANLKGWDVRNSNENTTVNRIVDGLRERLQSKYLYITDFPVGLESRMDHAIQFLRKETRGVGVYILGIWGMGGMGKSTIAKVIYNKLLHKFENQCFLANIREVWEKDRGQIDLQEQLLSNILKTRKMNVHSIEWGKTIIKERLRTERALVVLDDVSKLGQLNALCGNRDEICPGSMIIITTRDVQLLNVLQVDHVYEVEGLNKMESLELFSWHAFRKASPEQGFRSLAINVVSYCGGLPLALEVLGCSLKNRRKEEWESVLSKLQKIPHVQIQEILKISFDGLDDMDRDIFLDVCCFFIGKDRAYVTEILNGCNLYADIGIAVLIERSLIKVERNNRLGMHDLLRDMGREIVRISSPKEPEKRSRLWFYEDVLDVLTKNMGTEAIEGLALNLHRTNRYYFDACAFQKMKRLRLLQLDHVQLNGDYGYLSNQLRWICWKRFPLRHIPGKLDQGNVVAIDLKHSNLNKHVWKEPQLMERLKFLNLSHSKYLINTPDFSKLPNLEKLILKDCPNLCEIHQSIGDLGNLLLINLEDCTSLSNLPSVIYKLKSVKTLILSGCSKIDKLEEDIAQMESLTTLIAKNTSVKQVPFSIVRSKSIFISLCGYEGLSHDVFPSLILSWMSPTMTPLPYVQPFGVTSSSRGFVNLQNRCLGDLSVMLNSHSKLRSVWVKCETEFQLSKELKTILNDIDDANFTELEITSYASQNSNHSFRDSYLIGMGSYEEVFNSLSKCISEGLTTNGSFDDLLPGDNYPYWLTHTGEGHSVLFTVPQDNHCHMKGITLCVFYSSKSEKMAVECLISVLIVNYTKCTIQIHKQDTVISFGDEDWRDLTSHLGSGDKVEIFVIFGHGLAIKKTVVYLIFDESIDVEIESSLEPKKESKKNAFGRFIKKIVKLS